ncbi:sigma 54-interacting transcriptional regulator, partial [Leptospira sp. 96542]|nr:sigma 54-interacting transcriptional regulator [Leptospira sp. 96542]
MHLQFLSLSFLIAVLLCSLGVVYSLFIRNKNSGLKELALTFSFLVILYSACFFASIEIEPIGALHRWFSVTSATFAAIFFQRFFLQFPTNIFPNETKFVFKIELLIGLLISTWFIWESNSSPRIFRINGQYWDLHSDLPSKVVAGYSLFLALSIVVISIFQIYKHKNESRFALIGILGAFLLKFLVPVIYLTLFRLGYVPANVFVNILAISVIAGFFVFHIFFVSYGGHQTSLSLRILTIVLAMALCVTQVISGGLSRAIENEYESRQIASLSSQEILESLPDLVEIFKDSDLTGENKSERLFGEYSNENKFMILENKTPIMVFHHPTKKVAVGFSYKSYRNFIHNYVLDWSIRLFVGLCLLILGFLLFMKITILKPLDELLKAVDRVEGGELSVQIAVRSRDEIGLLESAFNTMVNSIREARDELQQYTQNLEKTILETDSPFELVPHEKLLSSKSLIYASKSMQNLVERAERIAVREQPILITGETGTGKEIIALLLHELGRGKQAPFVPINCSAVPANLWESQIFGHVKGAFTDAKFDYAGLVAEAKGGTLFFDEVGEMPLEIQPKILRLLQERKYKQVGGRSELNAECRTVFATHRNLREMVAKGTFREDLYYRINVFEIGIPPLRERRSDIPLLVNRFLQIYSEQMNIELPALSEKVMDFFIEYSWPGNIRELENCIVGVLANLRGNKISVQDLPIEEFKERSPKQKETLMTALSNSHGNFSTGFESMVLTYSKRLIQNALLQCKGNKSEAARILKISRG